MADIHDSWTHSTQYVSYILGDEEETATIEEKWQNGRKKDERMVLKWRTDITEEQFRGLLEDLPFDAVEPHIGETNYSEGHGCIKSVSYDFSPTAYNNTPPDFKAWWFEGEDDNSVEIRLRTRNIEPLEYLFDGASPTDIADEEAYMNDVEELWAN